MSEPATGSAAVARGPYEPPSHPPPPVPALHQEQSPPPLTNPLSSDAPPSHLVPAAQPRFSWQYIWSFFIRAPRVRAWLFQKDPPPATHVVQSLLSSPMLLGYIFGSSHEHTREYAFPDIGDLQTVFCRDGDAFLGFHFGFQGVQPIMPLLFQVIKDPLLGNPNVIVRRTARQRAPYPYHNYYLAMEFDWFESGALGVVAYVSPLDPDTDAPTGLCPYLLHAEHRIFNRRTAARLSTIADSLSQQVDLAFFPHPSHFVDLPADFVDPPDDYYYLSVREPDDPVYHANLQPAYVPPLQKFQTFEVEKDIPQANIPVSTATTTNSTTTATTSNTENTGSTGSSSGNNTPRTQGDMRKLSTEVNADGKRPAGALLHCDKGEVTSVAERGTIALWKGYQEKVAQSRRTGIILTMLGQKTGGRFAREVPMFGREARYVFLSTSGINVHGRIQRLCTQLGIELGSPLPDQLLIGTKEGYEFTGGSESHARLSSQNKHASQIEGDLDITAAGLGANEEWERRRIEEGLDGVPASAHGVHLLCGSGEPTTLTPISAHNEACRANSSTSSDPPSYASDGMGSVNALGTRHPKRRRFSATITPRDAVVMTHDASMARQAVVREPEPDLGSTWGPSGRLGLHEATRRGLEEEDLKMRGRGFDLTHILSEDNGLYVPSEAAQSKECSSATYEAGGPNAGPSASIIFDGESGSNAADAKDVKELVAEQDSKDSAEPAKGKGNKTVWTCDRCGVQIRGKKGNLNRHIANKHENIRAFACTRPNCGRKFQTRLNLVRHETAVHEGRPFTCPNCPRAFKYEDDLRAHIKSAHDEPEATLACEVCGSCFGRRSTLNRHIAKVHKPKEGGSPS